MDQAREYLARTLAWPQEGETPAWVNVQWTFKGRNNGKPGWGGRACKSLPEAVKAVAFALKGADTLDIYVCLSTQTTAEPVTTSKGYTYQKPIRLQANAVALKSLFLDIDCKEGPGGYPDQKAATTALVEFLKASGMPRPSIIVGSGGGMHVYWVFDEAIPPAQWKPTAVALAEATKAHGLKCDTQVTIDSARILRIPDTFNRKTETPRPVRLVGKRLDFDYPFADLQAILAPYQGAEIAPSVLPVRVPTTPIIEEMSAGITKSAPPVPLQKLADACGFIHDAVTNGGKDLANPLWNLTTLMALFTEEGRDAAHQMASGHAGYTPESTDALYDRKQLDKDAKGLGWPGCKTISATGSTACASCVHFAAAKTPFHFAQAPQVATPAQLPDGWDLPKGYIRDGDQKIQRVVVGPDGTQDLMPVFNYPMFGPWLQKNPWTLHFTTTTHRGTTAQIALPFDEASGGRGLRALLAKQGLVTRAGAATQHLEAFIVGWIEKLQTVKDSVVEGSPYGWVVRNGKTEGFAYANQIWTPADPLPAAPGDPMTARSYTPTGDPACWTEAAELITNQGRPALNAVLASAFAAPLVKFTGQSGLMLSIYSSASGIGKTTALKVAQAVWGDPVKAMQGLDDTALSVLQKMGQLKALPLYWDEMKTDEDTKKFVNLMFTLTKGKEKSRLNQDVTQRASGTWQTMLISASNESVIDYVVSRTKTSVAGIMRTFECEVPSPGAVGQIETGAADQIISRIHENYGQIGLEYAKWLGANFAQVEKDVAACRQELVEKTNSTPDERFWTAGMAVLLMGARYSNQLGYTKIDEPELEAFLVETLEGMRRVITEQPNDMTNSTNIENVLSQYLTAQRPRHTLITSYIPISAGKPPKEIRVVSDVKKLEEVFVHIGLENKLLRINSSNFTEWCTEKGYSRQIVVRSLTKEYGCKQVRGRIGGGTQYAAGGNLYLLEIDLAGTPFASILDGEV